MTMSPSFAAVLVGLALVPAPAGAQSPTWLDRAVRAEAARLATGLDSTATAPADIQQQRAGLSAWASVAALDAGSEVVVARSGAAPARYRLLSVDDDSLTILDVSSPDIPSAVASRLRREAGLRPGIFRDARGGHDITLPNHISIGPSGVSQRGLLLFPLSHVIVDVPRADVAEVSVIRKHVGQHARRGAVIGAIVGTVVMAAGSTSCNDCGSPAGWIVVGALGGALAGLEYGTIVGLIVPRSPDLIYRR
jgi:hypothetical protein